MGRPLAARWYCYLILNKRRYVSASLSFSKFSFSASVISHEQAIYAFVA